MKHVNREAARSRSEIRQIRISTKGKVVLAGPILRQLGLSPGDILDASVRDGQIVLVPYYPRLARPAIRRDAITGLPVLSAGPQTPRLTSEQVREILANLL